MIDILKQAKEVRVMLLFDGAIFDLDGTLIDSMDVWEKIDIDFLKKRNKIIPENYTEDICSMSFLEAAEYTIKLFDLDEKTDDLIQEWNEMAAYEYGHNIKLKKNGFEYLKHLKESGIKLAVATSLPEELYKPCLLNNGVYDFFDVVCSTDEVVRGKEFPDVFLYTAGMMRVKPSKCIVFEDVLPAVKSAKEAGMIVYGMYDKYSKNVKDEIKNIADGYIDDFKKAP